MAAAGGCLRLHPDILILLINKKEKHTYMIAEKNIPFQTIDWTTIPKVEYKGETGTALWQSVELPGLRIRIVEYSKGYLADHWCHKGHIVHCLEGEFISELQNGDKITLKKGMTYVVSDELSSHRSYSKDGVKVLIIDGEFLKLK
jgi:hypothetical protein